MNPFTRLSITVLLIIVMLSLVGACMNSIPLEQVQLTPTPLAATATPAPYPLPELHSYLPLSPV